MRRTWWIVAAVAVVGAPIAWYLGSPLFINKTVNEPFPSTTTTSPAAFPMSKGAAVPEGMTQQQVEDIMMKASQVNTSTADPMPEGATPTMVAHGTFAAAEGFHKGEGNAGIFRVGQELVLRLEPFKVTNGPDLHVLLTKQPSPRTPTDIDQGSIEVAKLKANVGGQNYPLPHGVHVDDYHAVVIYCKMFHVVFSTATLLPSP